MTEVEDVWLFDLGNTRLKSARLDANGQIRQLSAQVHAMRDGGIRELALPEGTVAHLASVAGEAVSIALLDRLSRRFGRIQIVRTQGRFAGLRVAYAEPATLGVDRFLAMLGAREREPGAVLVAAVGTALTIDLIAADGAHLGGRIAPSPDLMREALHARARQLPGRGGEYREFADATENALASGCEGAGLALIERSLAVASERLGRPPALLLHGGGADGLLRMLPQARHAPMLVLEGMALWSRAGSRRAAASA